MPLNLLTRNLVLTYAGTLITHFSAHDGDPGETGLNELSGGAYTREAVTWAAASAGNLDMTGTVVINIPAGTLLMYVGYWSALSAGTFRGAKLLANAPLNFVVADTYTLTDADLDFP